MEFSWHLRQLEIWFTALLSNSGEFEISKLSLQWEFCLEIRQKWRVWRRNEEVESGGVEQTGEKREKEEWREAERKGKKKKRENRGQETNEWNWEERKGYTKRRWEDRGGDRRGQGRWKEMRWDWWEERRGEVRGEERREERRGDKRRNERRVERGDKKIEKINYINN